jgi:phosphoglycolate phosphatase-like HAD superfamily hydrolase
MPKLLLFDIDGTLILTGGAGSRGMTRAFEAVFGIPDAFEGIAMPGRTDPQIMADALARAGIRTDDNGLTRFRAEYRRTLADELARSSAHRALVMPGVRALLEVLMPRPDVFLALLTGNYSEAARIKLDYFGLWKYFRCGAFGEDAGKRSDLVAVAVTRAHAGGLLPSRRRNILVVGDTPLDVECALASGVRPIAVATGGYSADTLRASGAETVFRDLSDTGAFLRLVDDGATEGSSTLS